MHERISLNSAQTLTQRLVPSESRCKIAKMAHLACSQPAVLTRRAQPGIESNGPVHLLWGLISLSNFIHIKVILKSNRRRSFHILAISIELEKHFDFDSIQNV